MAGSPPPSATASPATTSSSTSASTRTTIKVGMLADLSGAFAGLVQEVVAAQQVYWDNVNATGGIAGRQVELVIEDNAYDVAVNVEKYQILRDEVAILSQVTGSPAHRGDRPGHGERQPSRHPADVVLRLGRSRARSERVRDLHQLLHRVDERARVAAAEPRRPDGGDRLLPGRVRPGRRRRRQDGGRGPRSRGRLRRRGAGHPAVGRQPEPGPERVVVADRPGRPRPGVGDGQPGHARARS